MKKLKNILKYGGVKWYQVIVIGVLCGIIPPMFQTGEIKLGGKFAIGGLFAYVLFILFLIYNVWVDNKKMKK